jgi:hypothetical protein
MIISNTKIDEAIENIDITNTIFICCASFEERSKVLPEALSLHSIPNVIVVTTNESDAICKTTEFICERFGEMAHQVVISRDNPYEATYAISKMIDLLMEDVNRSIIIDITTFTHEVLLILLKILFNRHIRIDRLTFVYCGAKDYSIGLEREYKWLSKGCKDIRSILGFPGELIPGKKTCLIVLVGYEHERAFKMITEMDPDVVYLGLGTQDNPDPSQFQDAQTFFHRELFQQLRTTRQQQVKSFDFSCKDIVNTQTVISNIINETKDYNHMIIPLNTKISTLAVGLLALRDYKIQICYAAPETYNYDNYSTPGSVITVINDVVIRDIDEPIVKTSNDSMSIT